MIVFRGGDGGDVGEDSEGQLPSKTRIRGLVLRVEMVVASNGGE